ncbi:dynamin family protein [Nonomuraea sp. NPDC047529]|uniref:dynamin family protein n=1 Tax=Nonomuraea sp. NPDC047529 TaxID=3155623 RepID=UPI0033C43F69
MPSRSSAERLPSAADEPSSSAGRPSLFQRPPRADEPAAPPHPSGPPASASQEPAAPQRPFTRQVPSAPQRPSAETETGQPTGPSLFTPARPAERPSLFTPARPAEPREGNDPRPRPPAFWERAAQEPAAPSHQPASPEPTPDAEPDPVAASPNADADDTGATPSDIEPEHVPADAASGDDDAPPNDAPLDPHPEEFSPRDTHDETDTTGDDRPPTTDDPLPHVAPVPDAAVPSEVSAASDSDPDLDTAPDADVDTGALAEATDLEGEDADAGPATQADAGSDPAPEAEAAPSTEGEDVPVEAIALDDNDGDLDDTPADDEPSDTATTEATAATDVPADADYPTDPGDLAEEEFDVEADTDSDTDEAADADAVPEPEDPQGAEAGQRVEELPAEVVEAMTAALRALRESVSDLRFSLDLPGAEEARQARADLLAQLENYVLPRVRTNTAPALIVIAGSTGAGKSTLVNSMAERNISRTGVRRPTTGTPILACHPDDRSWFAEGELLAGLERLERPSPDSGTDGLVVVSTEKLPQGVALLDTPDIDSVVEEHHEIAHRMLDAADLWIFVTTAARYADAPAWNLLRLAKERGARLAIVLSRVQPRSADVVLKHFVRMLTEYGLGDIDRFVIHEATVTDGRLPDSEVTDLRLWLAELSVDEARRAQAVQETLNGVLNSFRTRVPALARHLEGQAVFRAELRSDVEAAYLGALAEIDKASKNGSLLHGEVLARWQDFAGSGDLMRSLQFGRGGKAGRQTPERVLAFKAAIRAGLESMIVAAANRAAEEVVARWRHRSELGAKLVEGLDRPSDNLLRHAGRAIASWQDHLNELVRTEGVTKRSVSKLVSFDPDALSLIFTVAMFSGGDGSGVPHRLVNALLGAESLRGIGSKALSDLRARIGMLFDEESMRYVHALDSAGIPDESVATRLFQATYNLEVAR